MENPDRNKTEDQLRYFLADSWTKSRLTPYNRWLENDLSLKVYVRRSHRLLEGKMTTVLDIANVNAEPTGTGRFTRFIEWVEDVQPYEGIFIESIATDRFENFFLKRNYSKREYTENPLQRDVYRLWNKDK